MDNRSVSILGENWDIEFVSAGSDPKLEECSGYCDPSVRKIVVELPDDDVMNCSDTDEMLRRVLRHELVHAMAHESGLDENSDWAMNEEMTAWVANQFPKLVRLFQLAGAM